MSNAIYARLKNVKEGTIFKSDNIVETNCVVCEKKVLENEIVYQADGLHDCCSLEHAVEYLNDNLDSLIWQFPF